MSEHNREAVLREFISLASVELAGDGVIAISFPAGCEPGGLCEMVLASNLPRATVHKVMLGLLTSWNESLSNAPEH